MRICFICDLHMRETEKSAQAAFFRRAVEQIKADNISMVITLGDITAWGASDVLEYYCRKLEGIAEHHWVLGNSDVRGDDVIRQNSKMPEADLMIGKRRLLAISTPFAELTGTDKEKIKALKNGDILCLHHSMQGLKEKDRGFLEQEAKTKKLTIIHGHSHKRQNYKIGEAQVIGLRALDPDKSIGDYPCITYFDISDAEVRWQEQSFGLPVEGVLATKKYFGISCVDNHKDVAYAAENGVRMIELRCNGADWEPDFELIPLLNRWRKITNGYLSVHMPNLFWRNGELTGAEKWNKAVDYAVRIGADGLTMHPPRVKKSEMPQNGEVWNNLLELYVFAVSKVGERACAGIENLHMHKGEADDENRAFGYTPQEVRAWIDAINFRMKSSDRVGHVLDVGHARNNGVLAEQFPVSRWYEEMGKLTVAYHIHQVVPTDDGLKNHQPIEQWFGPMISYASFFYCREEGMLNPKPTFLEVRGCENFEKSMKAFAQSFETI